MLLKNCFTITVFVACSAALAAVAAGCGGCRFRQRRRHRRHRRQLRGCGRGGRHGRQPGRRARAAARAAARTPSTRAAATRCSSTRAPSTFPSATVSRAARACPANPCHKGMFVCNEGAMTCMELTDMQANGTVCGMNMVCRNGSCGACTEGMACDVTGKPCRVGSIVCTTGAPVCTETDNKPNGTTCGTGMVCQAGTCATCQAGGACTPTNRCHTGTLVCSGAAPDVHRHQHERPRGHVVRDGHGVRRERHLRGLRRGHDLQRARQAVPPRDHRLQHRHAGLHRVVRRAQRHACAAPTWSARRATARPARPARPASRRIRVTPASTSARRRSTAPTPASRSRTASRAAPTGSATPGTCVIVRGGLQLPADQRLQDRHDVVRDRLAGLHGVGQSPNGTPLRHQHGVQHRQLRDLQRGRRLHADANPCHTGTLNCSTGTAVCTDSGSNQPDGTVCGTNLVCKRGQLRVVHRGSGLPADQPVQERRDRRARPVRWSAWRPPTRARARCAAPASRARAAC